MIIRIYRYIAYNIRIYYQITLTLFDVLRINEDTSRRNSGNRYDVHEQHKLLVCYLVPFPLIYQELRGGIETEVYNYLFVRSDTALKYNIVYDKYKFHII